MIQEASEGDPLNQVDALVVAVGTADVVYSKSISVQVRNLDNNFITMSYI